MRTRLSIFVVALALIASAGPATTARADDTTANERLNAVTVRDTAPRVALARRLLERHDRAPAILEAEVRLLQLSAGAIERVFGGNPPPLRLSADKWSRFALVGCC